jgi:nucleotide-binding universal stress UspA family protein
MKKLLICTDGSQYSEQACLYAAWLAQNSEVELHALYVTDLRQYQGSFIADLSGSLGIQPYDGMVSQLQALEQQKAKFVEDQTEAVFKAAGLMERFKFHHETGLLVDIIDDYADEETELIVIGKRGENADFATEHLGSMLERVVRATDRPCLVTSRKFIEVTRAAVAFDGGASSRRALQYLASHEQFRALELHVLTVAEGSDEDEAAHHLKEAESILQSTGLKATYQLLNGEVETVIAKYIESNRIELLVAGAYGHSRIRDLFIGSTTTELLRSCHVPVLCFR